MPRPAPRILVKDVCVLDPRDGSVETGRDVLLDRGRIMEMVPAGTLPVPDAKTVDAPGHVALPGLIDCHLHMCGVYLAGQPGFRDLVTVPGQVLKNLRALVESGVTTVRDMAGPLKLSLWLRTLARHGRISSPRLIVPGPILTASGGYPTFLDPLEPPVSWAVGQLKACVDTEGEARRWVDLLADQGVDFIKVAYATMEYDDARSPMKTLRPEVFQAITESAHARGLPVAAHHIWARDLTPLMELPFDTLEHLSIERAVRPDEVERILERNLPVTTTLLAYGIIDFVDEMTHLLDSDTGYLFEKRPRENLKRIVAQMRDRAFDIPFIGRNVIETGMRHMLENLTLMKQAGVLVGAGTDSGGAITPCGKIAWELKSFLKAGYSPLEAVRAATSDAARVIGQPELGVLKPGGPADLILCRGNPAEDLSALEEANVSVVIRDGMVFKSRLD